MPQAEADYVLRHFPCSPAHTKSGNLGMRLASPCTKCRMGTRLMSDHRLVLVVQCTPIRPVAPGNSNTITKADVWYACASWLRPGTTSYCMAAYAVLLHEVKIRGPRNSYMYHSSLVFTLSMLLPNSQEDRS